MKNILLLAGIGLILIYAALVFGTSRYLAPAKFMESLICPTGMTIDQETIKRNASRRYSVSACRNADGEIVYVSGRLLLIGLVPLLIGISLVIIWSRIKTVPKEVVRYRVITVNFRSDK